MNESLRFDAAFTPRERLILFECEQGTCPRCGRLRGFSVPDDCAELEDCPQPWDIEAALLPSGCSATKATSETLR